MCGGEGMVVLTKQIIGDITIHTFLLDSYIKLISRLYILFISLCTFCPVYLFHMDCSLILICFDIITRNTCRTFPSMKNETARTSIILHPL